MSMSRYAYYPASGLPPPIRPEVLADVKSALTGLREGRYTSAFLYARYRDAMERQGRAVFHPVVFGRMLAEYGGLRCQIKGAAAWMIVEPYCSDRNAT